MSETESQLIDLAIEQLTNLTALLADESETWPIMIGTVIRTLNLAKQENN